MSKKGGYQIIDFKNLSLTVGNETTVAGVYKVIEDNYNKRLVVSGIVIGSTKYDDVTVQVAVSGTSFVFNAYGYLFTVADDDGITVAVYEYPVSTTAVSGIVNDILTTYIYPISTPTVAGIVKQSENVPVSSEETAPTTAEFNALLKALKDAGIMEPDEE